MGLAPCPESSDSNDQRSLDKAPIPQCCAGAPALVSSVRQMLALGKQPRKTKMQAGRNGRVGNQGEGEGGTGRDCSKSHVQWAPQP